MVWHFAWRCGYIMFRYKEFRSHCRFRLVVRISSWRLVRIHERIEIITVLFFHWLIFAVANVKTFRFRR